VKEVRLLEVCPGSGPSHKVHSHLYHCVVDPDLQWFFFNGISSRILNLKGQCHEIFDLWFFS
jgi:hypothetical protein